MNNMRLCRCGSCERIATAHKEPPPDGGELACTSHATGDGWGRICSIEGCLGTPVFMVVYKVTDRRVRLATCLEHFQGMPNDVSEVYRLDGEPQT
jgi:hypothetical protein